MQIKPFMILVATALALTACGGGDDPNKKPDNGGSSGGPVNPTPDPKPNPKPDPSQDSELKDFTINTATQEAFAKLPAKIKVGNPATEKPFPEVDSAARTVQVKDVTVAAGNSVLEQSISGTGDLDLSDLPNGSTPVKTPSNKGWAYKMAYVSALGMNESSQKTVDGKQNKVDDMSWQKIVGQPTEGGVVNDLVAKKIVANYQGKALAGGADGKLEEGVLKYQINFAKRKGAGEITGISSFGPAGRDSDGKVALDKVDGKASYFSGVKTLKLKEADLTDNVANKMFLGKVAEAAIAGGKKFNIAGVGLAQGVAQAYDKDGKIVNEGEKLAYSLGLFGPQANQVAGAVYQSVGGGAPSHASVAFQGVRGSGEADFGGMNPSELAKDEARAAMVYRSAIPFTVITNDGEMSLKDGKINLGALANGLHPTKFGTTGSDTGLIYKQEYSAVLGELTQGDDGGKKVYGFKLGKVAGKATGKDYLSRQVAGNAKLTYEGKAWLANGKKDGKTQSQAGTLTYTVDFGNLKGSGKIEELAAVGPVREDGKAISDAFKGPQSFGDIKSIELQTADLKSSSWNRGAADPLNKSFGVVDGNAVATDTSGKKLEMEMKYDLGIFGPEANEIAGFVKQRSNRKVKDSDWTPTVGFAGSQKK